MDRFKPCAATPTLSPLFNAETGPFRQSRELRQCPFWSRWSLDDDADGSLRCGSLIDAIDADGDDLLVTHGKRAVLYRVAGEEPRQFATFELGTSRKHSLAYGGKLRRGSPLAAFGSSDGRCRIFTVREGAQRVAVRELLDVSERSETHRCCFFQETSLLAAYDSGHLRLFDISTGSILHSVDDLHTDRVRALAVSGPMCLTGSHDGTSSVLDCRLLGQPAAVVARFGRDGEPVLAVMFAGDKLAMAAAQRVRVFDTRTMTEPLFCLDCHHGNVFAVAQCHHGDKEYLLAGGSDTMLQYYDLAQGHHVHTMRTRSAITAIGCVPTDPGWIAVGTEEGAVNLVRKRDEPTKEGRRAALRPFERRLKRLELQETMEEVLGEHGSYKDFVDCLSGLAGIRQLDEALRHVDIDRFLRILAETMRELPGNADVLAMAASSVLASLKNGAVKCERESFDLLRKTIKDELTLQTGLLRIQGLLDVRRHQT